MQLVVMSAQGRLNSSMATIRLSSTDVSSLKGFEEARSADNGNISAEDRTRKRLRETGESEHEGIRRD